MTQNDQKEKEKKINQRSPKTSDIKHKGKKKKTDKQLKRNVERHWQV